MKRPTFQPDLNGFRLVKSLWTGSHFINNLWTHNRNLEKKFFIVIVLHYSKNLALRILRHSFTAGDSDGLEMYSAPCLVSNLSQTKGFLALEGEDGLERRGVENDVRECGLSGVDPQEAWRAGVQHCLVLPNPIEWVMDIIWISKWIGMEGGLGFQSTIWVKILYVMTARLSWHVQNCNLICSSFFFTELRTHNVFEKWVSNCCLTVLLPTWATLVSKLT